MNRADWVRGVVWVVAALGVAACQREEAPAGAPPAAPPAPREVAGTHVPPQAAPTEALRAPERVPEGARLFVSASQGGVLPPSLRLEGTVTSVAPEALTITPATGAPARVLLRLPPDMRTDIAVGHTALIVQDVENAHSDRVQHLAVRSGRATVLEYRTSHAQRPIQITLLGGELRLEQTERMGSPQTLQGVRRYGMVARASWDKQQKSLSPGEKVVVRTASGTYRLWVVGSVLTEPASDNVDMEGRPYHLTVVVAPISPGQPTPRLR